MLSSRLVQLIQTQWEQLTARIISQIRTDPELTHLKTLPEAELQEWGERVLRKLDHWLVESDEAEITRDYEDIGAHRYREGVPLHEAVRGAHILRARIVNFMRDQGTPTNTVELYAEEELEYRVGQFFDCLVYHLVKGYEMAMKAQPQQVRIAATATPSSSPTVAA
jgi:hypothetical protein